MSNSIVDRIERLQARIKREGRTPPFSKQLQLTRQTIKRAEEDVKWHVRMERLAGRERIEARRKQLWHYRHFMATGSWAEGAAQYADISPALERRLRAQHNAKRPRVGKGKGKLRYTD